MYRKNKELKKEMKRLKKIWTINHTWFPHADNSKGSIPMLLGLISNNK